MIKIYAITKFFVLLQKINTSMNHYSSYPSFKSALVLKCMYLRKYFYKTFLQHVFCVFTALGKAITNGQHFRAEPVIQFPLSRGFIMKTPRYYIFFCHEAI